MVKPPEPVEYPPPCSQTITGRLWPVPRLGVQTFNTRQSSPIGTLSSTAATSAIRPDGFCGAWCPNSRVSRTLVQGCGFDGGMNLAAPVVEAPYGTPLKALILSWKVPRILPELFSATGPVEPLLAGAAKALVNGPPSSALPPARNARRSIFDFMLTSFARLAPIEGRNVGIHVHPDRFRIGIFLHRFQPQVSAVPGLSDAAKRRVRVDALIGIDPNHSRLNSRGHSMRALQIAGPEAAAQTVYRGVGGLYHLRFRLAAG